MKKTARYIVNFCIANDIGAIVVGHNPDFKRGTNPNFATRLRVTVADPDKVAPVAKFNNEGAFGLVKNGHDIQVIVGLSVPQVLSYYGYG